MRRSLALSSSTKLTINSVEGFTLVELLIVMGVLAVLVVTILVSLNPSEAQKKTRDTKRMKDMRTLEAIVLQWINDGKGSLCPNACTSLSAGSVRSQPCSSNWLGVDVCQYANSVPVDPLNGKPATIVCSGGTVQAPTTCQVGVTNDGARYDVVVNGSNYHIGVFQESKSNANNVYNDGSTYYDGGVFAGDVWAEVASDFSPRLP